jgi:hypothetical protein
MHFVESQTEELERAGTAATDSSSKKTSMYQTGGTN